eukprot:TRINITY_DN2407_c0_g4_i3.p1 TRINITY_DN2407_c0_g4~~TRINITY_DN2407_c0_g4_i3.p1  ORF type:complete len:567 (+),score=128.51 TRINITY_DN2407_c0_g4_i3:634-2334(+)
MSSKSLRIGLIGYARFGQFLAKHFTSAGHQMIVINLRQDYSQQAKADGLVPGKTYFTGTNSISSFMSQPMDVLIFGTSIISFEDVLRSFVPYLKNHLVVDVLSVKSHPKQLMKKIVPETADILCTHPMFGPDSGKDSWAGLSFVWEEVRIRNQSRLETFLDYWRLKGCRMVQMTCEEHDHMAANTQFITHVTGRTLGKLKLQTTPIDTKNFQTLKSITDSVNRDTFDLFYALNKYNQYAPEKLNQFEEALKNVRKDLNDFGNNQKVNDKKISFNPLVENLTASKTAVFTDLARDMAEKGIEVITFSVGEPDFPPPKEAIEGAIEAINKGYTKYTALNGILPLRKEIAKYLTNEKKTKYTEDEILLSCGGKQSIFQAVFALCRPGDEVLIPAPYWVSYPEMVKLSAAVPVSIPTTAKNRYCITPKQLEDAITPKTRILILCSPSNPTGYVYTKKQLEELADVLRRHPHVYVISDEIYEKITFGIEHVSFASLPGMWERTLTVNGFSKSFAMTGLRLGYLAAPKPLVQACSKIQSHITTNPTSISQYAALAAMQKTDQRYDEEDDDGR